MFPSSPDEIKIENIFERLHILLNFAVHIYQFSDNSLNIQIANVMRCQFHDNHFLLMFIQFNLLDKRWCNDIVNAVSIFCTGIIFK